MLQALDTVPWADLEHAYGSASDVPALLQRLVDPDPKQRGEALRHLYANVYHQGTRYPATPFVIPFLIEMCASPKVPNRRDLFGFWGRLITGFFSVQQRPLWGDEEHIYGYGQVQKTKQNDPYAATLHHIYRESLKGHELLLDLLTDGDPGVRTGASWVLACLPTMAESSVPKLEAQLRAEPSGWVRATIAFALGELGAVPPLHRMLAEPAFPAARCMAACQLARIEPAEALIKPLLLFVSEPIEGYENVLGAGGKSTGDAAFSVSHLPPKTQQKAIPAICDRLGHARLFDTIPLVYALLSAAFPRRDEALIELSDVQRQILVRMLNTQELWSVGSNKRMFKAHGLPGDRDQCAQLAGVTISHDEALEWLHRGLSAAGVGQLAKSRERILKALELDPSVFERAPAPDESWLLCAKAFAESDSERALEAYRRATSINAGVAQRVDPTWRLADLVKENDLG